MTTALVLSAGGMFAAWQAGVWKVLAEHFRPDLIIGTSSGAWNGWLIAGGATPDELIAEWRDPAVAATWLFRPELLRRKAQELFSRSQPHIPFALTVVEVPHFRSRLIRHPDITWQYLAATCSIPGAFPPVSIDGRQFVDGGLLGSLPLWAAEELGATHAIALNCLTNLSFRMMRALLKPRGHTPSLEVTLIEPSATLGALHETVCGSHSNVERWIELGQRDANHAVAQFTM